MPAELMIVMHEDRTAISVKDAAALVGRSTTWIRNRVSMGAIDVVREGRGRRISVSLNSVLRAKATCRQERRPNRLRLVVDNTGK